MHPAYSVILFTTASGAGYGLLALLGLVALAHGRASSPGFAFTSCAIALALITIGLLSSTLHLGRPERFWRAFSQWRSSWLSREGVLAVFTYPVAIAFAAVWAGIVDLPVLMAPLALLTVLCCIATVWCTAMIYASLKTIRQWHHHLTVPVYLTFAVATGGTLLAAIAFLFERFQSFQALVAGLALVATSILKHLYWTSIDREQRSRSMAQATGLGAQVRQWEVPHTATNFVQKEMGYAVARKHAEKLRVAVDLGLAGAVSCIVMALLWWLPLVLLAPLLALAAAVVERWLFFAEAEHVSMLYYGAEAR
jgi:DMSO reductase anchor subunit